MKSINFDKFITIFICGNGYFIEDTLSKINTNNKKVIVLDINITDRSHLIKTVLHGRFLEIDILILMANYPQDIPPVIRPNIDYIILNKLETKFIPKCVKHIII